MVKLEIARLQIICPVKEVPHAGHGVKSQELTRRMSRCLSVDRSRLDRIQVSDIRENLLALWVSRYQPSLCYVPPKGSLAA